MKSRYQSTHAGQARKRLSIRTPDARQLINAKFGQRAAARFMMSYMQQVISFVLQGRMKFRDMKELFVPAGGWEAVYDRYPSFDQLSPREQMRIVGLS